MKKLWILLAALLLLLTSGCTAIDPDVPAYMPSEMDYSSELDSGSPEGLAQQSSQIYMDMVNGDLGPSSGFESLLELVSPESAEAMAEYESAFCDEVYATREYLKQQEDSITGFEFAETVYTGEDEAYILRIQVQESGNRYYFRQDFKCVDGVWYIAGDNIEDEFRIKHKVFFWYR